MKTVYWVFEDKAYVCNVEPGVCPFCGVADAVTALPPPLLSKQPDDTTHVCLPALDGCNQGFAKRGDA